MIQRVLHLRNRPFFPVFIWVLVSSFVLSALGPVPLALAQNMPVMPPPGMMVDMSSAYKPAALQGIQVYAEEPLRFDFLVDKGDSALLGQPLKDEVMRLIKYFLTALTVPDTDLWVNLSPYEKDRIAADGFGQTQMGKDLLEQDYLLKQITASALYPDGRLGREFWDKVYARAYARYGSTEIASSTFHKVWIVPKSADVYVKGNGAFVARSSLDVMLEDDYLAMRNNRESGSAEVTPEGYTEIFREVVLPELRREINEGRNFSVVRQVFQSMILATWYKRHLKDSLVGQVYVGQNKVRGVDTKDPKAKEKVFEQYLSAFKQGVYDYIRDDVDPVTQEGIPRRYVSGGMNFTGFGAMGDAVYRESQGRSMQEAVVLGSDLVMASVKGTLAGSDGAMIGFPDSRTYPNDHPFKDMAQQSGLKQKISGWLKKLPLPAGMATLLNLGNTASVEAAVFSQAPSGAVQARIEAGDTYGGILSTLREQFQRTAPEQYQQSGYAGELWGQNGVVDRLVGDAQHQTLYPGDVVTLPGPYPAEALGILPPEVPVSVAPSVNPIAMAKEVVGGNPALGVASPESAIPTMDWGTVKVWLQSAGNLVQEKVTALVSGISMPQVDITTSEVAVAGLCTAGLFGLFKLGKKWWAGRKKNIQNPPVISAVPLTNQEARLDIQDTIRPAGSSPEELAGMRALTGGRQAVQEPGAETVAPLRGDAHLEVLTAEPASSSADEISRMRELLAGFEPQIPQAAAVVPSGTSTLRMGTMKPSRWLDTTGWLAGMGLAGAAFGPDPVSLGITAGVLPFLTRAFYGAQTWVHETAGHLVPAALLRPGSWNDIFTGKNLRANLSGRQWLDLLLPWRLPDANPFVRVPLGGLKEKAVRTSGAIVSLLSTVGATLGAIALSVEKTWLLPLIGPVAASAWASIRAAWSTDRPSGKKEAGKFECGNYGVFWRDASGNKYPGWVEQGLDTLIGRLLVRGGQSAGQLTIVKDDNTGTPAPYVTKVVKGKRGEGLVQMLLKGFKRSLGSASKGKAGTPEVFGVNGHVRFATGGAVSEGASHPFVGPQEEQLVWELKNGVFEAHTRNVFVTASHNGDNDTYRLLDRDLELKEIRSFFPKLVDFNDVLPPGDSPAIPLQVHFHLTQGSWKASTRFSHVMTHYTTADAVLADVLPAEETEVLASVFERVFSVYAGLLCRPYYRSAGKSFQDLWVTPEMLGGDEGLQIQYEVLSKFKAALIGAFENELRGHTPVGSVLTRYPHQSVDLERFVDLTVKKFFTGDRYSAVREFQELAGGSYGLVVRTATHDTGVTIYSRNQGMTIGYNLKQGFFAFASDPIVLQGNFGTKGKLEKLWVLDLSGRGEVADIALDPLTGSLKLKAFSVNRNQPVSASEISAREYPLNEENPYYSPLVEYQGTDVVEEDIRMTTGALHKAAQTWHTPGSFNQQSGDSMAALMTARAVERHIKMNSLAYAGLAPTVTSTLRRILTIPESAGGPGEPLRSFLDQELRHGAESLLVREVRARVNAFIAEKSDEHALQSQPITAQMLSQWTDELEPLVAAAVDREITALVREAQQNPLALNARLVEALSSDISADEKCPDFFISGYENSLWFGENFKILLHSLMPGLRIEATSSNKVLRDPRQFGIGPRTIALVFSKSGSTFPSLGQSGFLSRLTQGNTFAMTARVDSMLSMALGQKLRPDAPFSKRIFVTGNYYPAEAATVSEILLYAGQIQLAVYLAKRMRAMFPDSDPWGLRASDEDIRRMEELSVEMLRESERITGFNAKGQAVESPVHEAVAGQGRYLGMRLLETPVVTWIFRAMVCGIFWFGAPIQGALSLFGVDPGPTFDSVGSFLLKSADAGLTLLMPFLLTTLLYRKLTGQPLWSRLGPPTMTIGENSALHQSVEGFVSKLGGFSIPLMNMQVHGANPEDHLNARFAHRIVRGSLIVSGLPSDAPSRNAVIVSLKQAKSIRNGIFDFVKQWGWGKKLFDNKFEGGAEIITVGRGSYQNKDVTDHHVDIGAQPAFASADPLMSSFNKMSFDSFGRLLAYKVMFNEMYKKASTISIPEFGFFVGKHKVALHTKTFHLWNRAWTYPSISVHTTRTPIGIPEDFAQTAVTPAKPLPDQAAVPAAENSVPGGIDMNTRDMELNLVGESAAPSIRPQAEPLDPARVQGLIPEIIDVVPVGPAQLQLMLGFQQTEQERGEVWS